MGRQARSLFTLNLRLRRICPRSLCESTSSTCLKRITSIGCKTGSASPSGPTAPGCSLGPGRPAVPVEEGESPLCSSFLPTLVCTHDDTGRIPRIHVDAACWRRSTGRSSPAETRLNLTPQVPPSVPHESSLTLPTPSPDSFTLFLFLKFWIIKLS